MRLNVIKRLTIVPVCLITLAIPLVGCETRAQTGAAAGGGMGAASGAAAGAAAGAPAAGVGALIGGAAGATIGGIIGAQDDKNNDKYRQEATRVSELAQRNPAVAEAVKDAPTADVNGDGWTTMDEIVAMKKAGLSDQQMTDRIRRTQQVFYVGPDQREYLRQHGVSQSVVEALDQSRANATGGAGGDANSN
jgi:hypothetical protein